ncbi:hypothetical protein [Phytohabitans rumicis]|uniref:Uncharacterized protein n=1 Tax=Phytohabitans rumicis TaxID=1076125 RepID=A0A6V8LF09_9ACTN|nr:hypothetical protein [Phytohabitans rumicis]GFJ93199.1 hypothetical protein Prum_068410 [Phytohabitans rumicis]
MTYRVSYRDATGAKRLVAVVGSLVDAQRVIDAVTTEVPPSADRLVADEDLMLELMARPAYIVAKAVLCGAEALVADHAIVNSIDGTDTEPATTALALTGAGFLLGGLTDRRDIAATLLVSLLRADTEHGAARELRRISDDPMSFGIDWVRSGPSAQPETYGHVGAVTSVASHGSLIASGGEDGTVRLWNLGQQRPRTCAGHTGWVFAVAISADGLLVASAGDDGMIRLWDTRTDMNVGSLVGHTRRVRSLAFTRSGRDRIRLRRHPRPQPHHRRTGSHTYRTQRQATHGSASPPTPTSSSPQPPTAPSGRGPSDANSRTPKSASRHCAALAAESNRILAGSATTVAMPTCGDPTEKG